MPGGFNSEGSCISKKKSHTALINVRRRLLDVGEDHIIRPVLLPEASSQIR